MEREKTFTILAIDGGGIRGVLPAKLLAELEAALERDGRSARLRDHFDLICGTSTGAIIALALAMGLPAQRVLDLYKENARMIFGPRFLLWPVRPWFLSKYHNRNLEKLVRNIFKGNDGGDTRLADLGTRVCIPAYDLLSASPRVFKTPHHSEFHRDLHIPAYQVALASGAAPTYFDPFSAEYNSIGTATMNPFKLKVDGGIFANNPALIGLIEAHRAQGVPLEKVRVLSLGTGQSTFSEGRQRRLFGLLPMAWGRFYWLQKARLFDVTIQAQAQLTHFMMKHLAEGAGTIPQGHFLYKRVTQELGPGVALPLDAKRRTQLETLEELGMRSYQEHGAEILRGFLDGNNMNDYAAPTVNTNPNH